MNCTKHVHNIRKIENIFSLTYWQSTVPFRVVLKVAVIASYKN